MKLIFRYLGQAIRNFPKCFCVSMGLILALTIMETFVPWGLRQYLEQIEEQNYEAGLIARGIPKERIRKYGFAFCGKRVLIG